MIFWVGVLEVQSHGVACKVCVQQELWASALTLGAPFGRKHEICWCLVRCAASVGCRAVKGECNP